MTMPMHTPRAFIMWFAAITIGDIPIVGGKNSSLGEMMRQLTGKGVRVPVGFAITADAFRYFIREARLAGFIRDTLADLDTHDMVNLSRRGYSGRQGHPRSDPAGRPAEPDRGIISAGAGRQGGRPNNGLQPTALRAATEPTR